MTACVHEWDDLHGSTRCGRRGIRFGPGLNVVKTYTSQTFLKIGKNVTCKFCLGLVKRSGNRTNNSNNPWGKKGMPRL